MAKNNDTETKEELDVKTETDDTVNDTVNDTDILSIDDDADFMLTTIDNPYSPKTEYAKWQTWDADNGYNTEEFIGRLLLMEETFDINDEVGLDLLTNKVIQEILDNDVINSYILV